jgi:uncharacterized protein with gpF-like domain
VRIAEVDAGSSSKLVNILRTIIASADQKGTAVYLHFNKPTQENMKQGVKNLDINKIMANVGGEQFDYGTFKAAYDTDPRIKTMVKNFSQEGIEPKTQQTIDTGAPQADAQGDVVGQMAKSATDLGDKL